jgi:hypothetical protein
MQNGDRRGRGPVIFALVGLGQHGQIIGADAQVVNPWPLYRSHGDGDIRTRSGAAAWGRVTYEAYDEIKIGGLGGVGVLNGEEIFEILINERKIRRWPA